MIIFLFLNESYAIYHSIKKILLINELKFQFLQTNHAIIWRYCKSGYIPQIYRVTFYPDLKFVIFLSSQIFPGFPFLSRFFNIIFHSGGQYTPQTVMYPMKISHLLKEIYTSFVNCAHFFHEKNSALASPFLLNDFPRFSSLITSRILSFNSR